MLNVLCLLYIKSFEFRNLYLLHEENLLSQTCINYERLNNLNTTIVKLYGNVHLSYCSYVASFLYRYSNVRSYC